MTRTVPEPVESPLGLLVFLLAMAASFFGIGYALAAWAYDHFIGRTP